MSMSDVKILLKQLDFNELSDIKVYISALMDDKRLTYKNNTDALEIVTHLSKMIYATEDDISKMKDKIHELPCEVMDSVHEWFFSDEKSPYVRMCHEENDSEYYDEDGNLLSKYVAKMNKIKMSVDMYKELNDYFYQEL